MVELATAFGLVAPYYNAVFSILVVCLFIHLFRLHKKRSDVFIYPWKLIFAGLLIFMVETAITILRQAGALNIPIHINGFFELAIIILFIYALLKHIEFLGTSRLRAFRRS